MYKGIAGSEGIGIGNVVIIEEHEIVIENKKITDIDAEIARLQGAIEKFVNDTNAMADRMEKTVGAKDADILRGHIQMLQDPTIEEQITALIVSEKITAEKALDQVLEQTAEIFAQIPDELLQQRATDFRDIKARILKILLGIEDYDISAAPAGTVLVAHDLTPSMTAGIVAENIAGILTEVGGRTSHSAILARAMEIPAVLSIDGICTSVKNGDRVVLNGTSGEAIVNPDAETEQKFAGLLEEYKKEKELLKKFAGVPTVSADGTKVELVCNIGKPEDAKKAVECDGEGIGLFRTEFLFMDRDTIPTEEEQFEAYKSVAETMKGKPVIIRTLDIGGDKEIPYLGLEKEDNPFLGYRAIRFCLQRTDIYNTQLRALVRASAFGRIKIMVPLVTGVDELRSVKAMVADIMKELDAEGIAYNKNLEIGIMMETPAACMMADVLAKEAAFFSIGTNDLTGYTMAVEAVHVKMHHEKLSPYKASVAAINEIGGAIIAITLVMSAVFVPVGFMQGTVGIFYRQFSLTLAVAIVISGINALTLSPALCALLLKPADGKKKKKAGWLRRFFIFFNRRYDRFEKKYNIGLHKYLSRKIITYATLIIFFLATFGMSQVLPSGFIPNEDQGMIYVNVDAPPGATLERSEKALNAVQAALLPFKEIESISTLAGYSLMTETEGANFGMGMINLTPWSERDQTAAELIEIYKDRTSHIKDADIQFFLPPTVPGFGNASGFELRLQDKTAGSFAEFADVANTLVEKLNEDPRIVGATSGFNPNFPQYLLKVDIAKAAKLGVNLNESMETLQSYIGSFYSSNFIRFGQMYKVMLQASPEYRMNPEDLYKFYAKNKDGNMVPYSNFMTMDRIFGPNQITRYNMFTSALITGEPAEGVSSGEVIEAVEQIAKETLPRGYDIEWSGVTREEKDSGGQTVLIFGICLLFVYLLLAAQYESLLLPFPVILSLPAGIFGSYFFLQLAGLENNIYAQVALVMLIGLLGKNAILIVEMANQYRKQGMSIFDAAVRGSVSRLRPILMTVLSMVFGLVPLMMAHGVGANGSRSLATGVIGGMIVGTLALLFLVPSLFITFQYIQEHS
mgnify:CR=1 FL=1